MFHLFDRAEVLFAVIGREGVEARHVAAVGAAAELVGIHARAVRLAADDARRDVGAVVGDALDVGEKLEEYDAGVKLSLIHI